MPDTIIGEGEIAESGARGAVAEIYADIRQTLGLPLVNLIWRRLATAPDALAWAWQAVRPVYADGLAESEAARLLETLPLPRLPVMPSALLDSAGLGAPERRTVAALLDAYNRGNSLNLVALSSLLAAAPPAAPRAAADPPVLAPRGGEPPPLPPIPPLDALPAPVREMVLRLNRFGLAPGAASGGDSDEGIGRDAGPGSGAGVIVASLYRHLAHWPGYLALAWCVLAPHASDGTLAAAIAQTRAAALVHGASAAAPRVPPPDAATAASVHALLGVFIETAIARMVPIGVMLRRALPAPG